MKIGPAIPEICLQIDRQTDSQSNFNTLLSYWGGVTILSQMQSIAATATGRRVQLLSTILQDLSLNYDHTTCIRWLCNNNLQDSILHHRNVCVCHIAFTHLYAYTNSPFKWQRCQMVTLCHAGLTFRHSGSQP